MNNTYLRSWCLEKVCLNNVLCSLYAYIGPWFCCNSDLLPRLLEARTKEDHYTDQLVPDENAINENIAKGSFSQSDKKQFCEVFWVCLIYLCL